MRFQLGLIILTVIVNSIQFTRSSEHNKQNSLELPAQKRKVGSRAYDDDSEELQYDVYNYNDEHPILKSRLSALDDENPADSLDAKLGRDISSSEAPADAIDNSSILTQNRSQHLFSNDSKSASSDSSIVNRTTPTEAPQQHISATSDPIDTANMPTILSQLESHPTNRAGLKPKRPSHPQQTLDRPKLNPQSLHINSTVSREVPEYVDKQPQVSSDADLALSKSTKLPNITVPTKPLVEGRLSTKEKEFSGPKLESELKPKIEPIPKPKVQPTPEPRVQQTTEPKLEPKLKPRVKPITEPKVQPTPEPRVQPTPEPKVQPTPEPRVQPTPEPRVQPTTEPKLKPTPEPTPEPTSEPTLTPAEELNIGDSALNIPSVDTKLTLPDQISLPLMDVKLPDVSEQDSSSSMPIYFYLISCLIAATMPIIRYIIFFIESKSQIIRRENLESDSTSNSVQTELVHLKQKLDLNDNLHKELERANFRRRRLEQKIRLQEKLRPLKEEISKIRKRLGDNVDQRISDLTSHYHNLRNLQSKYGKNKELRKKMKDAKCEQLLSIQAFVELEALLDVMNDIDFKEKYKSLEDSTLEMQIQTNFLSELMDLYRDLTDRFASEYKELQERIAVELENRKAYDKEKKELKLLIDELDFDMSIEIWRRKISDRKAEAEGCYNEYRNNHARLQDQQPVEAL